MSELLFVHEPLDGPAAAERDAARRWLRESGVAFREAAPSALAGSLGNARVLWWHGLARPSARESAGLLRDWISHGGTALLTLQAAALVGDLGLDPVAPNRVGVFPWVRPRWELSAHQGERRGFFPYFHHPLFEGLPGGAVTLVPVAGHAYPEAVYDAGAWPSKGRVVARESAYLDLDPTRVVAWEAPHGRGLALCLGAHLLFATEEGEPGATTRALARNALRFLSERRDSLRGNRHWPRPEARIAPFRFGEEEPAPARGGAVPADATPFLASRRAIDEFFDLAGLEVRVLAKERSGVAEVWTGALRAMRDRRIRFLPAGGGPPVSEEVAFVEHRTRPFSAERVFRVGAATVVERLAPELASPAAVFDWRVESGAISGIEFEAEFDHRLFWPMREGAAGALRHGWSSSARAFAVRDEEDRFAVALGFDRLPTETPSVEDRTRDGVPRLGMRARFGGADLTALRAVVAGSDEGHADALEVLHATFSRGARVFAAAAERSRRRFEEGPSLATPDRAFDEAFGWTAAMLAPFVADYPRIGRAIAAGFQTTRPGWNAGRPGYDWLFGRDTFWSAHALLAIGLRDAVLGALEAFLRLRHPSGKILHEATPSGAVHYDAADATPLFLVAVDRYLRWSGDLPFAKRHAAAIRAALDFAFACDRDGDGLIENAGVGHGWVEGGPLHGKIQATFYLNACWAEALACATRIARVLEDEPLERRCRREHERVRAVLDGRLFDRSEGRFAFALRTDGHLDATPTIEPAVGALFGVLDPAKVAPFLAEVAGPRYETAWGVRFLPNDHPAYDPKGYHHGAVWPLFTGWVAWSHFRHHRAGDGLRLVRANLAQVRKGALGCIPEVLHGERDEPAGVCPHQAWSHALTISALVAGLLGFEPDAAADRVAIAPHLPSEWPRLGVRRLAFGDHALDFEIERRARGLRVRIEHRGPRPLRVDLAPGFPLGETVERVAVDGHRAAFEVDESPADRHASVSFSVPERAEVVFETGGGAR